MKTSKRGQYSRKPFLWKFCNTLFLGWTCFKKLCNFGALGFFRGWQNYPLLTSTWRNYTPLYVTIFVTFMPSICFCNNYELLGATDLYEVSITSCRSLVWWKGDKITQRYFKSWFFQRNLEVPNGRVISAPQQFI